MDIKLYRDQTVNMFISDVKVDHLLEAWLPVARSLKW